MHCAGKSNTMSDLPLQHPSHVLQPETIERIRQYAAEAEILRRLHPVQVDAILENKWFKMFVPKQDGGLGLTLPEALHIQEGLSWTDGSMAWVVTLCAGAGWFVGFVDRDVAEEFFAGGNICIAGSGAVTGVAEEADSGYMIDGLWKYASGALHATAFTANCEVRKKGEPRRNPDGSPVIRTFIFRREEVLVSDTWRSMGMIATASHSFEVRNRKIPFNRSFQIDPACAVLDDPLYCYPFLEFALATLSVNLSGMASRFIDLAESMVRHKSSGEKIVADTRTALDAARTRLFKVVAMSWTNLTQRGRLGEDLATDVAEASHNLVKVSRWVVNELYPKCGLGAADSTGEINRVWRNFHTAAQHALFEAP